MKWIRWILFACFVLMALTVHAAIGAKTTTEINVVWVVSLIVSILLVLVGWLAAERLRTTSKTIQSMQEVQTQTIRDISDLRLDFHNTFAGIKTQQELFSMQQKTGSENCSEYRKCVKELKKMVFHQRAWMQDHVRVHASCKACPPSNDYYDK